ncbi:hypothetical protein QBC35DRAFT_548127 [Podospora australis]|uniref:GED domain-containing protein n=1 Tax=Podospora australis TaxID=1536484 RepID=A0AAN6WLJ4_9PEZI|nr:hypothetical protein QBC35DRAFT_548127 [Podospora australis]
MDPNEPLASVQTPTREESRNKEPVQVANMRDLKPSFTTSLDHTKILGCCGTYLLNEFTLERINSDKLHSTGSRNDKADDDPVTDNTEDDFEIDIWELVAEAPKHEEDEDGLIADSHIELPDLDSQTEGEVELCTTIVLPVVSSQNPVAAKKAREVARNLDPSLKHTLGVIAHVGEDKTADTLTMSHGVEYMEEVAGQQEESSPATNTISAPTTAPNQSAAALRDNIESTLRENILAQLPRLSSIVEGRINAYEARLKEVAAPRDSYINMISNLYHESPTAISLGRLGERLESLDTDSYVGVTMTDRKQRHVLALFRDQATYWQNIANRHIDLVLEAAMGYIERVIDHALGTKPHTSNMAKTLFTNYALPYFDERKKQLLNEVSELAGYYLSTSDLQPYHVFIRGGSAPSEPTVADIRSLFGSLSLRGKIAEVQEVVDEMQPHYERHVEIFAQHVIHLVVKHGLFRNMATIFGPNLISNLSEDQICELTKEEPWVANQREKLPKQLKSLRRDLPKKPASIH